MSKGKAIVIGIAVLVVLSLLYSCVTGGDNGTAENNDTPIETYTQPESNAADTTGEPAPDATGAAVENAWDANLALVGMTVEAAWDTIEAQGYTVGAIYSPTGAELNSDESIRHTSTAQTWRVTEASANEQDKTVALSVTSHDDFVNKFGAELLR